MLPASIVDPTPARITDIVANLGHLCDAEYLDFIPILEKAVQHWSVEREGAPENPEVAGPDVQITIGGCLE